MNRSRNPRRWAEIKPTSSWHHSQNFDEAALVMSSVEANILTLHVIMQILPVIVHWIKHSNNFNANPTSIAPWIKHHNNFNADPTSEAHWMKHFNNFNANPTSEAHWIKHPNNFNADPTSIAHWIKNPLRRTSEHYHKYDYPNFSFFTRKIYFCINF